MTLAIPQKLANRIQHYAWGQRGQNSLIHRLLGTGDSSSSAAELWMGAHPSAPSEIISDAGKKRLDDLIQEAPEEYLGEPTVQKFGPVLPFLFKVLSIRSALSIQAHPDKLLARELHRVDPSHYPDENHKPEMAIAVSEVELLYGFRPLAEIRAFFEKYSLLSRLLRPATRTALFSADKGPSDDELLRMLCTDIFHVSGKLLQEIIGGLSSVFREHLSFSREERWFLLLSEEFPDDVGLICFFLLNFVVLSPNEAIFVGPNIPHAYLSGDLLECMASSDNVVRAGLTNKYKDIETLLRMLRFQPIAATVIQPKASVSQEMVWDYIAPTEEFHLQLLNCEQVTNWEFQTRAAALVFCLEGKAQLTFSKGERSLLPGDSVIIPACTRVFSLSSSGGKFYHISIPVSEAERG